MRLLSWNVYNKRRDYQGLDRILREYQPDIVALQEVPTALVQRLQGLEDWHLHVAEDFVERGALCHLATLTRAASRSYSVGINADRRVSSSIVGRLSGWTECLDAQITALDGSEPVTVINLHLSCAVSPTVRMLEIGAILQSASAPNLVVCGDFNSFGRGLARMLGPLFGFSFRDLIGDEMQDLETVLSQSHLTIVQPVPPCATLPRFGLVLDHFAVSTDVTARARVISETHGSDHRPILLDLD